MTKSPEAVRDASPRHGWIDAARGLGIVLVVYGHAISGLPKAAQLEIFIWSFHIPLFFFLSGLVERPQVEPGWPAFVRRLWRAIVLPYLTFSLLAYLWWLIAASGDCGVRCAPWWVPLVGTVYGVSAATQFMVHDSPLWFLTCLFSVKVYARCVDLVSDSWRMRGGLIVGGALLVHLVLYRVSLRLPWNFDIALIAAVFHYCGRMVAKSRFMRKPESSSAGYEWVMFVIGAVLTGYLSALNGRVDMNFGHFGNLPLFYLAALCGVATSLFAARRLLDNRLFAFLGRASLAIFALHFVLPVDPYVPPRVASLADWYAMKAGLPAISHYLDGLYVTLQQLALCCVFHLALLRVAPWAINAAPRPRKVVGLIAR